MKKGIIIMAMDYIPEYYTPLHDFKSLCVDCETLDHYADIGKIHAAKYSGKYYIPNDEQRKIMYLANRYWDNDNAGYTQFKPKDLEIHLYDADRYYLEQAGAIGAVEIVYPATNSHSAKYMWRDIRASTTDNVRQQALCCEIIKSIGFLQRRPHCNKAVLDNTVFVREHNQFYTGIHYSRYVGIMCVYLLPGRSVTEYVRCFWFGSREYNKLLGKWEREREAQEHRHEKKIAEAEHKKRSVSS